MTSENERDFEGVGGMGKLKRIKFSIRNNWDRWGNTDDPVFGVLISVALAIPGVVLWYLTTGIPSALGVAWVIINLIGPLKWVMTR